MPLLLIQFGTQTTQVLGFGGCMVGFAGETFSGSFFVVEAFAVLLLEALDVLVLRHLGALCCT